MSERYSVEVENIGKTLQDRFNVDDVPDVPRVDERKVSQPDPPQGADL